MATRCTGYRRELGAWLPSGCVRDSIGDDGLCGQHHAGRLRRNAHIQAINAEHAVENARYAFVKGWREQHPDEVFETEWVCPLCGLAVQRVTSLGQMSAVSIHQQSHRDDWTAYEAITNEGG